MMDRKMWGGGGRTTGRHTGEGYRGCARRSATVTIISSGARRHATGGDGGRTSRRAPQGGRTWGRGRT